MPSDYPTCEERIDAAMTKRIAHIRKLLDLYYEGNDEDDPDLGNIWEYGLSLEWSQPDDEDEPRYIRYILSTGGPHEEFRFWLPSQGSRTGSPSFIKFVYQDWWDGAERQVMGDDIDTMAELYEWFIDAMPDPED